MASHLHSIAADGRVPLRVRVSPRVAEALHDEALDRRVSASVLVERVLREGLPVLAEERVRTHVGAPARERLAAHLPRNAQRPGGLTPGRASGLSTDAATSVPGDGIEPELGSGGTPA